MKISQKSKENLRILYFAACFIVFIGVTLLEFWDSPLIYLIRCLIKECVPAFIMLIILFWLCCALGRTDEDYFKDPRYDDFWGTIPIDGSDYSVRLHRYVICHRDNRGHCYVLDVKSHKILEDCTKRAERLEREGYVYDDPRMTAVPIKDGIYKDKETGRYMCICQYDTAFYFMDLITGDPVRLCDGQRLGLTYPGDDSDFNPDRSKHALEEKKKEIIKLHQQMLADTPEELRDKEFWNKYVIAGHESGFMPSQLAIRWIRKPIQKDKV